MQDSEYKEILEHLMQRIELLEKKLKSKKADKDYDGDGKIESGSEEYLGSRDKAIKKAMGKKSKSIEEALAKIGGNKTSQYHSLQTLADNVDKNSPLVESTVKAISGKSVEQPKTNLKDGGTKIQLSERLTFGGFPTINKE